MAAQPATDAYLRQRGLSAGAFHSCDVKINEMLARDCGKASQHALHISSNITSYEESYMKLGTWIRSRPAEQLRELNLLRFPMFVHCFLALVTQIGTGAPARFLEQHAQEHRQGSNVEKKRQVEQLMQLANPQTGVANSPIAKLYLTQRVSWVCSATSFEAVTTFLVDAKLHLLLRVLVLYFNVHAVRREPLLTSASAHESGASASASAAISAAISAADSAADASSADTSTTADATPPSALWGERQPSTNPMATQGAALPTAGSIGVVMPPDADATPPATAVLNAAAQAAANDEGLPEVKREPASEVINRVVTADAGMDDNFKATERICGGKERRPCSASVCVLRFCSGSELPDVSSVDVSTCLRVAACGRTDGAICLFRIARERIIESRFHAPAALAPMPPSARLFDGHTGPVYSCALSRDERFLLSAAQDGGVRLWAARHAQCLVSYRGHSHPVFHVSFSSHNAQFLTSCYDGAVRLFTTERRTPLRVLGGHTADVNVGVFHPNGACAQAACMTLWPRCVLPCALLRAPAAAPDTHVHVCVFCESGMPTSSFAVHAVVAPAVVVWQTLSPPPRTQRCDCGTSPQRDASVSFMATRVLSHVLPSHPMARSPPLQVRTAPCACGTSRAERCSARSRWATSRSALVRFVSLQMVNCLPAPVSTPSASGRCAPSHEVRATPRLRCSTGVWRL